MCSILKLCGFHCVVLVVLVVLERNTARRGWGSGSPGKLTRKLRCMCSVQIGVNDDVSWLLAPAQNNQPVLSINRSHENNCSYSPKKTLHNKLLLEASSTFIGTTLGSSLNHLKIKDNTAGQCCSKCITSRSLGAPWVPTSSWWPLVAVPAGLRPLRPR